MAITMEELKRKAKAYDEALESAKEIVNNQNASLIWKDWLRSTFPELKESKGEEIRKELMDFVVDNTICKDGRREKWIAWLEKQVPIDEDEIVEGIRRGVAISLMNHIDANSKGMCLSNMECEDIENAIINEDWDKVYGYMKKKLGQQEVTKTSDQVKDSAWSEEDEIIYAELIKYFESLLNCLATKERHNENGRWLNWIKSLKFRKQWKPSEEQMNALAEALILAKNCGEENAFDLRTLYEQLKKL